MNNHTFCKLSSQKKRRAGVIRGHCSCKEGSGRHCNHTFALLFQIVHYSCSAVKDIPSDASCTSLPQSWHIPRASSICPLPVMTTHYAKASTDQKRKRKRDPVRCTLYDARGSTTQYGLSMTHIMSQVSHLKQKENHLHFLIYFQTRSLSCRLILFSEVFFSDHVHLISCKNFEKQTQDLSQTLKQ